MHAEVKRFFDEFVAVFPTFDGAKIALRYAVPYMAVRADGGVALFASPEAVAAYFQEVVNRYRARGCTACRYSNLEVTEMGTNAALGTVSWELTSETGAVLSRWRESYQLVRADGHLKVRVSVDHAQ